MAEKKTLDEHVEEPGARNGHCVINIWSQVYRKR